MTNSERITRRGTRIGDEFLLPALVIVESLFCPVIDDQENSRGVRDFG